MCGVRLRMEISNLIVHPCLEGGTKSDRQLKCVWAIFCIWPLRDRFLSWGIWPVCIGRKTFLKNETRTKSANERGRRRSQEVLASKSSDKRGRSTARSREVLASG